MYLIKKGWRYWKFSKNKKKKCEELINSQNIKEKQESILLKIYGQNIKRPVVKNLN